MTRLERWRREYEIGRAELLRDLARELLARGVPKGVPATINDRVVDEERTSKQWSSRTLPLRR